MLTNSRMVLKTQVCVAGPVAAVYLSLQGTSPVCKGTNTDLWKSGHTNPQDICPATPTTTLRHDRWSSHCQRDVELGVREVTKCTQRCHLKVSALTYAIAGNDLYWYWKYYIRVGNQWKQSSQRRHTGILTIYDNLYWYLSTKGFMTSLSVCVFCITNVFFPPLSETCF